MKRRVDSKALQILPKQKEALVDAKETTQSLNKIIKTKYQALILITLFTTTFIPIPKTAYLTAPTVSLLLSLVKSRQAQKFPNGLYFVVGFCISLCIAPFSYFLPNLAAISPDANFYIFAITLNFIFVNVVIIQTLNLIGKKVVTHKANLAGLVVAILISLNFYKELIDPSKQKYLLNYFIRAGWDNVAHFGIF